MPNPPGIPPGRGAPPRRHHASSTPQATPNAPSGEPPPGKQLEKNVPGQAQPPQSGPPGTQPTPTPGKPGDQDPDKIVRPHPEEYAKLCELSEHAEAMRFLLEEVSGRRARWGVTYNRVPIIAGDGENSVLAWPLDAKQCEEDGLNSEPLILQVDYEIDDSEMTTEEKSFATIEDAFVRIRWGGCRHIVDVDLVRGFQIDLTGPRVLVDVVYPKVVPPPGPQGPPVNPITQPMLVIHASLGIGSTKSNPGITGSTRRTVRFGTVTAGGSSPLIQIPRWASSVVFQSPDLVAGMLNYRQFTNAQGTTMLASADLGKLDGASMPIAHGATYAQFHNNGLADAIGVRAIYYLAI